MTFQTFLHLLCINIFHDFIFSFKLICICILVFFHWYFSFFHIHVVYSPLHFHVYFKTVFHPYSVGWIFFFLFICTLFKDWIDLNIFYCSQTKGLGTSSWNLERLLFIIVWSKELLVNFHCNHGNAQGRVWF